MTDSEWYEHVKAGDDIGWKEVWLKVVEPEAKSGRSAEMMRRYSLDAGDLMGKLFHDMLGRGKIELYRHEGSFAGWLRQYVRGYVLAADPASHGEVSLDGAPGDEGGEGGIDIPVKAGRRIASHEVWDMTHRCFFDLWMTDPERCYIHLLKTKYRLSSEAVREFLDVSSAANVDQIFSRSVKFLRKQWLAHEPDWE